MRITVLESERDNRMAAIQITMSQQQDEKRKTKQVKTDKRKNNLKEHANTTDKNDRRAIIINIIITVAFVLTVVVGENLCSGKREKAKQVDLIHGTSGDFSSLFSLSLAVAPVRTLGTALATDKIMEIMKK